MFVCCVCVHVFSVFACKSICHSLSVCPFIAPHLSYTCVVGHRFSPGWYCGSVAVK